MAQEELPLWQEDILNKRLELLVNNPTEVCILDIFYQRLKHSLMKTYKVVVLNIAKVDVKEAHKWYDTQLIGLGKRFADDMKTTLLDLAKKTTSFAVRGLNLRLANFKTFPYAAHFFINNENDTVFIIAILYTKRHPDTSSNR